MNDNSFCSLLLAALLCSGSLAASFEDLPCKHVWYGTKEAPKEVEGEVLLEAKDVCLLLQAADGRLTLLQPKEILKVQEVEGPLRPYSKEAMGKKLLEEMPEGFRIHTTPHFVICYDTTDAYAKWAGGLYERLYKSFQGFWREKKFALEEPRFPLVALIFQTKASYLRYAQPEIGKSAESMFGYYNVMSNRVVSFDLTGIEGAIPDGSQVKQGALVQRILAQPDAERNVATIVHECVHQLSYNSGLQVRMADNPIWVSEGLAMFFETPDLSSTTGWGSIGKVNQHNMVNYIQYRQRRPITSLVQLLSEDERFKKGQSIQDAYAEAWAFNFFLLKKRPKEYVEYLKMLSKLTPLGETDPKERINDFQHFFGNDLNAVDREFQKFIDLQLPLKK